MMWSRQGLFTICSIGFGRLVVSGRRRRSSPPAMTTAWIESSLGPRRMRRLTRYDSEANAPDVARVLREAAGSRQLALTSSYISRSTPADLVLGSHPQCFEQTARSGARLIDFRF